MRFHSGDTLRRPGGVALRYWSVGRGVPLVFLHGLAGYGGEWGPFVSALDGGIAALTFDQRGHGQSTRRPSDVSRQAYVKDVAAVIEEGAAGRPVTLVGQSMGAHTAMLTAAAYPELVEKLVMIEGGVGGGGQPAVDQLRASLGRWPSSFADRQSAVSFFGGGLAAEVWVAGLEGRGERLFPQFDLDVMVETMRPVFEAPAWAAWQEVRQPTLIVLGGSGSIDRDQINLMAHLGTRSTSRSSPAPVMTSTSTSLRFSRTSCGPSLTPEMAALSRRKRLAQPSPYGTPSRAGSRSACGVGSGKSLGVV